MKRITLRFTIAEPSITPDVLREAVEQALLRLHPQITYKIRHVADNGDGTMRVEMVMDGKRDLLETIMLQKGWKLPVKLEEIGWGWIAGDWDTQTSTLTFEVDPLVAIQPLDGQHEFQLGNRRQWLRYIFLIISTLMMILLLAANGLHYDFPALQWIYIIGFALWLFYLNETPFDIRIYARKIICSQEGLKIDYWYMNQSVILGWKEIWGMDFSEPVCKVYTEGRMTRFLISERFGCKQQKPVLKTIVERARLNYVEGNFRNTSYRRYEADEARG